MEERNEYMLKLEKNLTEYNAKLEEMKAKAAKIKDDMKADYLSRVESLEKERDDLAVKYSQLKESSGQAWDDIKIGTQKTWSALEEALEKAVSRYK